MDLAQQFNSQSTYSFRRKIGSGGSSEVFLYSRKTGGLPEQEVALKILKCHGEEQIREILNEGRRLGSLRHPNILTAFGYERIDKEKFGLVLEYFPGENLKTLIPRLPARIRGCSAEYIVRTLCEAVSLAHSQGIVHGDIGGRNVLVSEQGQLKLSDFGLATRVSLKGNNSTLLKSNGPLKIKGSADYMAPECWNGYEPSVKADVFSLGILCLELLSGLNPLSGGNSPSTLVEGHRRVQEFLTRGSWRHFSPWNPFFEACLREDPSERLEAAELLKLIPILSVPLFEIQKEIAGLVKSSFTSEKEKTQTHLFSRSLTKRAFHRTILGSNSLALIFFLFSVMTSASTGLDHGFSGRLRPCFLTLTSRPWGELFVDGLSRGFTPFINLPLTAGFHTLVWTDPKGEKLSRTLMAFENGMFAYKISNEKGRYSSAPLPAFNDKTR